MGTRFARRNELIDAAAEAYDQARIEVYNRLPDGATVDTVPLTDSQRQTLSDLMIAEADLANYRFDDAALDAG
jgi:hypothetical protein